MPFVFRQGSTRVTAPVLRFSSGTLSLVAGEAVYAPSGGGGGTSDHTALSNLGWTASGHTGTASRLAGFDSGGAAAVVSVSSPLTYSGGALGIPAASGSQAGYLSSSDWSVFNGKEPAISAGTTSQYWRGDKSWQALDKAAVGLGNVENTALSTWAGSANLTTLGTIATGTWNGSTIGAGYGGTGIASYTAGDLVYATGSTTLAKLGIGSSSYLLSSSGSAPQWSAPGDLAISGGSIQVTQARGLRESGGTTLAMAAVAAGELLARSGSTIAGVTFSALLSAYSALLAAIAGLGSNGLIVRTGSSTTAARTITATDPQVTILNGDGVSGDPDFYSILPGFLSGEYYAQWITTEGATATGTLPVTTTGVTYNIFGTNNFPSMTLTSTTTTAVGYRSSSACFCLAQGFTHRFQFVTGSTKTLVRWRIGLAGASVGNALKPATHVAYLAFDTDSGQANAATNWYLLTYDNSGGAVSYSDTGVACNVSTAYESEITTDSTHVYVRVRTVGGAWSGKTVNTASLPPSTQGLCASFGAISTTAATTRSYEIRSYHVWGRRA